MTGPVVGTPPDYQMDDGRVPWLLGTHLHPETGPLDRAPEGSRVLMVESREFARRRPYHHQKLTLVFAAMRHARDALRERGYQVMYLRADTFAAALEDYFDRHPDDELVVMRSPSHRSGRRLRELGAAAGGSVDVVPNELFVTTPEAFDEWADRDEQFTHEQFYRWVRRETGVLMDGDDPAGGEWNYDDRNREFPPPDWDPPSPLRFEYDDLTAETSEWVSETFDAWGDSEQFCWPVTREQAQRALDSFLTDRLPEFGPYQDAMRADDPWMAHSLLSPAIHLGLLHPWEVVTAAEAAYEEHDLPINSVEGFVRQVLGWREFTRHVYRHGMPDLASANRLDATADLPDFFWTADTEMTCLRETLQTVRERGYSHHIQRLMVLANFCTLWGVDPAEFNDWFHAAYVDGFHWVTTPNVIEMGSYAADLFATKPYVSSANYVDRMSDYCTDCRYDPGTDTGAGACPFNALYWDFLDRNEDDLRSNHRMSLMYGHVDDRRDSGEMGEIRERVSELRDKLDQGEL